MIAKYQTVGITFDESKIKLAAILFDKVYCPIRDIYVPKDLIAPLFLNKNELDFVTESLSKDNTAMQIITENIINPIVRENSTLDKIALNEAIYKTKQETNNQFFNTLILEVSNRITNGNVLGIPLFNKSILKYNFRQDHKQEKLFEKVEVEMINTPIIDCSDLEWNQIVEAKKDAEFIEKVKRFSVFINKNYSGKDLSFITDDLNIQLEDYKNVCKKHGIKLTVETIKTLSNSKSLFGTLSLTILSMLAEMPQYAIATGTIGAVLELANIKINLKQYKDQYEASIKNSPISLIYDIEKMQKN